MKTRMIPNCVVIVLLLFSTGSPVYAYFSEVEYTPDANTVGLWHFNENSGTTAFDTTA